MFCTSGGKDGGDGGGSGGSSDNGNDEEGGDDGDGDSCTIDPDAETPEPTPDHKFDRDGAGERVAGPKTAVAPAALDLPNAGTGVSRSLSSALFARLSVTSPLCASSPVGAGGSRH